MPRVLTHRLLAVVALSAALVAGCGAKPPTPTSSVKFDAANSVAVNGSIRHAKLVTNETDDDAIRWNIRHQIWYTMGQLNAINAISDLSSRSIAIESKQPMAEPGLYEVTYSADLFLAWDRARPLPDTYRFYLPFRLERQPTNDGDSFPFPGLKAFFEKYAATCSGPASHPIDVLSFPIYYRPEQCDMETNGDPSMVARVDAALSLSPLNTTGKTPEYGMVWQDGRLVVTAIFAKNHAGSQDSADAGVRNYNRLYRMLRQQFGEPTAQNIELAAGEEPGLAHPHIQMVFTTPQGSLDVDASLIDDLFEMAELPLPSDGDAADGGGVSFKSEASEAFKRHYRERVQYSDFVTYNGHAGRGINVQILARMAEYQPNQYRVFLINGCNTFAYMDNALVDAHARANPGASPTKFIDTITNAMPAYFGTNNMGNMSVINGLLGRQKTYREILAGFDPRQRAIVTGEEDNAG